LVPLSIEESDSDQLSIDPDFFAANFHKSHASLLVVGVRRSQRLVRVQPPEVPRLATLFDFACEDASHSC
jgi:hypothetical protein